LRPREAAEVLGISERFLWELTRTGVIPCVRLGKGKRKAVLYPISTLREWLASYGHAVCSSEWEGL
jgi:excisionase family DNA binding protein